MPFSLLTKVEPCVTKTAGANRCRNLRIVGRSNQRPISPHRCLGPVQPHGTAPLGGPPAPNTAVSLFTWQVGQDERHAARFYQKREAHHVDWWVTGRQMVRAFAAGS
jgi:hypothetical protein